MAFRKRNVVVAHPGVAASSSVSAEKSLPPGGRPSPIDGRLTTSTGTRSLDTLLGGYVGLALGTSLLIEEGSTTDFGGALLRYYAAEGVVQGHHVHVLGANEAWGRELPGLSDVEGVSALAAEGRSAEDKMKIAWRYERLGEFGVGARDRSIAQLTGTLSAPHTSSIFCHEFDLSKRLLLNSSSHMQFVPATFPPNLEFANLEKSPSPFATFLTHLSKQLLATSSSTVHRVVIPTLFSPALYSSNASSPQYILQFLHALRALLRKYPAQLTAMITLPLALHPRNAGLTRWVELLSDGVLELAPFPSTPLASKAAPGASTANEEPPQGILKIHRLPVCHEKGGGGREASGMGDDLAFTLGRRKGLVIKPFSLPPVEGDSEGQHGGLDGVHGTDTKIDFDF